AQARREMPAATIADAHAQEGGATPSSGSTSGFVGCQTARRSNIDAVREMVLAAVVWLAHPAYAGQGPVPNKQPPQQSTDFLPAQNLKPADDLTTLRRYHDAVLLYRQSHREEAMAAMSGLARTQVEFVMATLRSVRRGKTVMRSDSLSSPLPFGMRSDEAPFKWPRPDLVAAGLLQGDITMSKVDKEDFEDELRLTLSMLPIADLPQANSSEQPGTWTRDWLRAVGNAMLASKAWGPLRTLLKYADLLVPQDGPLLLVRGTLDELQSE